jgi:hypothetical protein
MVQGTNSVNTPILHHNNIEDVVLDPLFLGVTGRTRAALTPWLSVRVEPFLSR